MRNPAAIYEAIYDEVSTVLVGQDTLVEQLTISLFTGGHILLEGVPGVAKTTLANVFARATGLQYNRIQMTPDILPADITGTTVYRQETGEFELQRGPIFANVVLADEINRAPPKTQSALLEAMEEEQVTVDGDTHELPDPFFVIATQNPVEMEGTFELPEAQVDRFAIKTAMGYPDEEGEFELLRRRAGRTEQSPSVEKVLDSEAVRALRTTPESITVEEDVLEYIARLCRQTRQHRHVEVGVSPRGTQRLFEMARARATIVGREFVTPDDVKRVAQPGMAHRLVLTPDARVEDIQKSSVVSDVLGSVEVPTV